MDIAEDYFLDQHLRPWLIARDVKKKKKKKKIKKKKIKKKIIYIYIYNLQKINKI